MIDTHAHTYSEEFEKDREAMIDRALAAGVSKIYMPAIDSGTHSAMLQLADRYPENCLPMIGLHPCYVKENYREELAVVEEHLTQRKFHAIGEAGLDLYWDKTFANQQVIALKLQADLAIKYELPLILHTREATRETIEVINEYKGTGLRGIFHCFGGNVQEAKDITDLGFFLGIGGVVTYKNGGLKEVLPEISLDHIVLETDAPYLSPVPFRGKRNEPSYLPHIAQTIAGIKGVSLEDVLAATTRNAESIFSK